MRSTILLLPAVLLASCESTPDDLTVRGHQRTRFEHLDGQFRSNPALDGSDHIVALRTAVALTWKPDPLELTAEVLDSRQFEADAGTPLGTSIVNAAEVLQAYAGLHFDGLFHEEDEAFVLLGRHTMDLGSRRLVARNRFRNTINNFDGLNATWKSGGGDQLRAFYVLPITRRPTAFENLDGNDIQNDKESEDTRFFGLFAARDDVAEGVSAEVYALGLQERDGDFQTANRELFTFGGRAFTKPRAGAADVQLESVIQIGESRSSRSASNTTDLDHRAHFQHAEIGYSLDAEWAPRLALQVDWASGDEDPGDGENNRFDTLFGARRFDFGPTGIFGAFARSNLISPGYRLNLKPGTGVDLLLAQRLHYLASRRDAWTTSGARDADGASGRYVGHLAELRLRWKAIPDRLDLELGVARLFLGGFAEQAPNASGEGDATYAYLQSLFSF